jgi:hypothetical protein
MTQTCTPNDVIQYAYNELNTADNSKIESLFLHDEQALAFYLDCIDIKAALNTIKMEPSQRTLDHILAYSRSTKLNTTHWS